MGSLYLLCALRTFDGAGDRGTDLAAGSGKLAADLDRAVGAVTNRVFYLQAGILFGSNAFEQFLAVVRVAEQQIDSRDELAVGVGTQLPAVFEKPARLGELDAAGKHPRALS